MTGLVPVSMQGTYRADKKEDTVVSWQTQEQKSIYEHASNSGRRSDGTGIDAVTSQGQICSFVDLWLHRSNVTSHRGDT